MPKKWISGHYNLLALNSLGMTSEDMVIIDWFKVFIFSSKIVHKDFLNSETNRNETFYWINYQGLLDDLAGSIKIKSKKSIARRFQKYCHCGLMYFHLEKKKWGTYTFYRFNENVLAKLFDETYIIEINSSTKSNVQKTEKSAEDKVVLCAQDNFVQLALDKIVPSPQDKNVQPKYRLANNRKATTAIIANTDLLSNKLTELFGSSSVFTNDFITKLDSFLTDKKLCGDEKLDYLKWMFEMTKKKSKTDKLGFFYKMSLNESFFSQFNLQYKKQEKVDERNLVNCPACGCTIGDQDDCPSCGLFYIDRTNPELVLVHHNLFLLSPDNKNMYEAKYTKMMNSFPLKTSSSMQTKRMNEALHNLWEEMNLLKS